MTDTRTHAAPTVLPLVATGLVAAVGAAAATVAVAAAGHAAGISLDVSGAPIPLAGFATMTVICAIAGLVLAAVLSRVARHPRTAFVRSTVVLTVVSLGPDLLAQATPATKMLLMLTHLVAAAIVIPAVARRLAH